MNDLLDWIANQGFAIAIAGYLIIRIDVKLDKLIKLLEEYVKK